MRNWILILLIFCVLNSGHADTFYYTVLAKSGLALRKEKSLKSEKLDIAKFKEKVELLGLYRKDKIVVEKVEGFWVHVRYNNQKGFMFSGYLFPGEIFYSDDNNNNSNYLILDEIGPNFLPPENGEYQYLHSPYFDESKKWYGVEITNTETKIEKVVIDFNIDPSIIQEFYNKIDNTGTYLYTYGEPYPLQLRISTSKKYNFFIGTTSELKKQSISEIFIDEKTNLIGRFIHPWTKLNIDSKNGFYITAKGKIKNGAQAQYIEYQLVLKNNYTNLSIPLKISHYEFQANIDYNVNAESPKLVWAGYLNEDKIPDFIIEPAFEGDKCVEVFYMAIISKETEGKTEYEICRYGINFNSIIK